jgi:hypothetical protein
MADFHSWSKQALIEFAETAAIALQEKDERIVQLAFQLNRLSVRQEVLAEPVATATLSEPCKP